MALDPNLKFYLIDPVTGNYFYATENANRTWVLNLTTTPTPVTPPKGWDGFKIVWERNSTYYGVLRSMASPLVYVNDARAILRQLFYEGYGGSVYGTQAQCILRIDILDNTAATISYNTLYKGYIDFSTVQPDDIQNEQFTVGSMDSALKRNLSSRADVTYNIPFWVNTSSGGWVTDAATIYHPSIKVLYSQNFTTGATASNPISLSLSNSLGNVPFIPSIQRVDYVQVNGSQTYVGNDLLQQMVYVGQQQFKGEVSTGGTLDCYQQNNYVIKNLISDGSNLILQGDVQFIIHSISFANSNPGQFTEITFETLNINSAGHLDGVPTAFVSLRIGNQPSHAIGATVTLGNLIYMPYGNPAIPPQNNLSLFHDVSISYTPSGHAGAPTFVNGDVTLCAITNSTTGLTLTSTPITFDNLEFVFKSNPSDPSTGIAIVPAPKLPPSPAQGFRPLQLLQKLTQYLFSTSSDSYGFPDLTTLLNYSGETAVSDFLTNRSIHDPSLAGTLDPAKNWDNVPFNTLFTSGNSLRDISGVDYMTTSLGAAFKTMQSFWSVGMGIETNSIGVEQLKIEPLIYFFNKDEIILELGYNYSNMQVTPITSWLGNKLKTGYQQRQQNADYGIDTPFTEQDYLTPIFNHTNDIDMSVTYVVDPYQIEFARAEQNNKDQSGANSDNGMFAIEVYTPSPETEYPTVLQAPDGTAVPAVGLPPVTYPTVQNTDNTAASAPYILGLNYPDTMINMGLTPARNVLRNGALLASILTGSESQNLTFIKQFQLLYNNWVGSGTFTEALYPAVRSNLQVGSGSAGFVAEASDIPIRSLNSMWGGSTVCNKLFGGYMIKITTSVPINTYQLLGSNPTGCVSFLLDNNGYEAPQLVKGFIWELEQEPANNMATTITLVATPDTEFLFH